MRDETRDAFGNTLKDIFIKSHKDLLYDNVCNWIEQTRKTIPVERIEQPQLSKQ